MFRKTQIDMSAIVPTSKMALKLSCLTACKNNIEEATRLYEYMSADLTDLPDLDPEKPSVLNQVMSGADNIVGWIGQHQQDIVQGISIIQSLRKGVSSAIPDGVPPIPTSL